MSIVRPLSKNMMAGKLGKKMGSISGKKLGLCLTAGSLFTLGFVRGCQEYYYWEIKNKNTSIEIKDYLTWSIFGLINGSLYVNPAMSVFALSYEYDRTQMRNGGNFDEKKYYTNPYLGLFNNEKVYSKNN
jgi:hypothetical protein